MGIIDAGRFRSASSLAVLATIGAALLPVATSSAEARPRHRSHTVAQPAAAQPQPHSYYPENVQGGVPGNLPFNNQIRKLTDPLNANGAGH